MVPLEKAAARIRLFELPNDRESVQLAVLIGQAQHAAKHPELPVDGPVGRAMPLARQGVEGEPMRLPGLTVAGRLGAVVGGAETDAVHGWRAFASGIGASTYPVRARTSFRIYSRGQKERSG